MANLTTIRSNAADEKLQSALRALWDDFTHHAATNPLALNPLHLFALAGLLEANGWKLEAKEVREFIERHVITLNLII